MLLVSEDKTIAVRYEVADPPSQRRTCTADVDASARAGGLKAAVAQPLHLAGARSEPACEVSKAARQLNCPTCPDRAVEDQIAVGGKRAGAIQLQATLRDGGGARVGVVAGQGRSAGAALRDRQYVGACIGEVP